MYFGSNPQKRCIITVLPERTARQIFSYFMLFSMTSSRTRSLMPYLIVLVSFWRPSSCSSVYITRERTSSPYTTCLLYTSDAADEEDSVDLGGRRIIKKKKTQETK